MLLRQVLGSGVLALEADVEWSRHVSQDVQLALALCMRAGITELLQRREPRQAGSGPKNEEASQWQEEFILAQTRRCTGKPGNIHLGQVKRLRQDVIILRPAKALPASSILLPLPHLVFLPPLLPRRLLSLSMETFSQHGLLFSSPPVPPFLVLSYSRFFF